MFRSCHLSFIRFTYCVVPLLSLSSVFHCCDSVRSFLYFMANASRPEDIHHPVSDDIPAAAQRVPRSTLLHTILFKRISFPLTSRRDELWIVEVDQTGHETWSPLEEFLYRFCPPVDPHLRRTWADSWREHFDIPPPNDNTSQDSQYPVLPQPNHARTSVGRPASWIPDHSHILRACWGLSAGRFSQCDPSPSLLQPVGPILSHPEVPLARSNQPEPEPNSHPYRTSTLTTSTSSSHAMEMNQEDDHS